jgi:type IV pilus assembly protein PilW
MEPGSGQTKAFTLIEILISMALLGIITAAIYSIYRVQQKSYLVQEEIVTMQQTLRSAMLHMCREIRRAGFDPDGTTTAGITAAQPGLIAFTYLAEDDGEDNDNDGLFDDPSELKTVRYTLYDSGSDGDNDLGEKVDAANNRPMALNVDGLSFVYLSGNGTILNPGHTSVSFGNLPNIRAVEITLVARAVRPDMDFTDSTVYRNKQNEAIYTAPGDHFRRGMMTTTVYCRNM